MIVANRVSVAYGARVVLREVSLQIDSGEVVVLVGPNGAGKSTLLRVLSGDLPPLSGEVSFDGRPIRSLKLTELARRRAVVPQQSGLDFPFRVREVVLMGRIPHLHRSDARRDGAVVEATLAKVGLDGFAERSYLHLSGGERQRVHLARALAQIAEPGPRGSALLLDEPVASLDLAHQHRVLGIARDLAARGVAVMAVLHDLNLAAQYADRIAILSRGSVCACGAPATVLTEDQLTSVYETPVTVVDHPCADCPLVVNVPARAG